MTDEDSRQNTVSRMAYLSGIALHTGNRVNLTLHPAPSGSGIVFRRVDLPDAPEVKAELANVIESQRATTIRNGEAVVYTVEHLLAALYACGIDNALVEVTGPEPPICDGSAASYVELVKRAGFQPQKEERKTIKPETPLYYEKGETTLVLLPADTYVISCVIKYNATPMDCQYLSLHIDQQSFVDEIAPSRTFCNYQEIETLINANLICGGSLDNAIVMKDGAIMSREGLRFTDEFVRHKILDMIGDFSLLGRRIRARILAVKSGHAANIALARQFKDKEGL